MYSVFADGAMHYLGANKESAMAVLDSSKVLHSKTGGTLVGITTLSDLQIAFEKHIDALDQMPPKTSPLDDLLKRLEEMEIDPEEIMKVAQENGEKAIGQVRSMGLRGLKGLGEGFTALGDLLQKAGEEDEEPAERNDE